MAYRFQDLEGNWRMRYDDGTTSPVITDAIHVNDLTSTKDVNRDTSASHRAQFGTDDSFISIKDKTLGGGDSTRMDELRNAIIDKEMSGARISTYQAEFQPLAEMASTQDTLISTVASNPLADPEARAGAFQALYPGMKVGIDDKGNLSFSAKNSDLGFQYPDRKKMRQDQLSRDNPDTPFDMREKLNGLNNMLSSIAEADSPETLTNMLADAAALVSEASTYKSNIYRAELSSIHGVDFLEQELVQGRLLDEQERIQRAGWGEFVSGDSPVTSKTVNSLAAAKAGLDNDVRTKLSEDVDLARLATIYKQLETVAQQKLGRVLEKPDLLPPNITPAFNKAWNDTGEPLTSKQNIELAKKLESGDPTVAALAEAAVGEASTALQVSDRISGMHKPILERMFDNQFGEPGLFRQMDNDVKNFEVAKEARGIVLTPAEDAVLAELSSPLFKNLSPKEQDSARARALSIKTDKIIASYKEARDDDFLRGVVSAGTKPSDEMTGNYWEAAIADVRNDGVATARAQAADWDFTSQSKRVANKLTQIKIDENPESTYKLNLEAIASKMTSRLIASSEFPDIESEREALGIMINSMSEWLSPQAANAKGHRAFGPVDGATKTDIERIFISKYTTQRTAVKSVYDPAVAVWAVDRLYNIK